jgi:hypothetical protein
MRSCVTTTTILAAMLAVSTASSCPDIQPAAGLNLTKWVEKTWYVAQQQLNGYQKISELFCTLATYDVNRSQHVPFFKGDVVSVHNYENQNHVNGKVENTDVNIPSGLCARAVNETRPSQLSVAPCFLPNLLGGPYWIISFDELEYEWGVIAGGKPTVQFPDGCTTKETGVNGSGLWIFVRDPLKNNQAVANARDSLIKMGYTLSRLLNVTQEGCKYEGARIKN